MKRKNIFFIILILVFRFSFAQSPGLSWAKVIGNKWNNYGLSVTHDNLGNVYTTGVFLDTTDFDPGASTYTLTSASLNYDIFISKLDAAGNFVWAKKIGGGYQDAGNAITVDKLGNVYVTGYFKDTIDFDPGPGVYNLFAPNFTNGYVLKLNSSGNFIWAVNMNPVAIAPNSITVDSFGNVYSTGIGNQLTFVSKINISGALVWTKSLQSTLFPEIHSIALDNFGGILLGGLFSGTTDFDPGPGTFTILSQGQNDIFIEKLDSSGNFVWAKTMGGIYGDECNSLAIDSLNNIYITGSYGNSVDFDPGPATYSLSAKGGADIFVCKLDSAGSLLWAKSMGGASGDIGYSITTDAFLNVYTTGTFGGLSDFDPGVSVFNINSGGQFDIFINKLNSSGNFLWASGFGYHNDDFGYSISVDKANYIYATGYFGNIVDFDPSPGTFTIASIGPAADDIFILKLCQTSTPVILTSGPTTLCQGNSIVLTSNSASTYSWNTGSTSQSITVNTAGTYSVITTDTKGCSITSNSINILVNPLPILNASTNSTLICTQPSQQSATLTVSGANTYTWNPIGIIANSVVVNPTITTTYTINGVDANGCANTATLTQIVSNCIGINEFQYRNVSLEIYPNPNSGDFTISVTGLDKTPSIEIYNTIGKLVYKDILTTERNTFNTNLAAGIYFINIIENNKVIATQKLICK